MSIRVEYRSATAAELGALGRPLLPPGLHALWVAAANYVLYWFLAFAVLMTVGALASVADAHAAAASVDGVEWRSGWKEALLVTLLWGPVFVLPGIVAARRGRRAKASRWEVWTDRRERRIEVVQFDGEPYTTIECGKAGRFHVFAIAAGETFCLSEYNEITMLRVGKVLDELEEHAGQWSEAECEAELLRRVPGFPSTRFEIHRWPRTGTVVDVRSTGQRLDAEKVVALDAAAAPVRRALGGLLLKESGIAPLARAAYG